MRSSLQLVSWCSRWDADALRSEYEKLCKDRCFDLDMSQDIADELMPDRRTPTARATKGSAAQECADLMSQVQQHAEMESEGLEAAGAEKTASERELGSLPDSDELQRLLDAQGTEQSRPARDDDQTGAVASLRAALCLDRKHKSCARVCVCVCASHIVCPCARIAGSRALSG